MHESTKGLPRKEGLQDRPRSIDCSFAVAERVQERGGTRLRRVIGPTLLHPEGEEYVRAITLDVDIPGVSIGSRPICVHPFRHGARAVVSVHS